MATISCKNCATEIEATAKFCRQCGQPTNLWEATTRTLEPPPPQVEASTQRINPAPTAPSYMSPRDMPPFSYVPQSPYDTSAIQQKSHKRAIIILSGAVGVLLLAVVAIAFLLFQRLQDEPARATVDPPTIVEIPRPPHPPVPPVPPAPRQGPAAARASIELKALAYPGAEIIMEMNRGGGGVLQMRTADAADKVAQWYIAKLGPTKQIRIPGGNVMLRSDQATVIITGGANETNIVVKHGADQ